jgi:membrane protease YdiL (CAAX protease family)
MRKQAEHMDTMVARRQPLANRLLLRVLRSPLAGAVDGSLLALTVRGRQSGRAITLPVQYAAGDDAIWVWPGRPATKTWWRNLRLAAPVQLRLLGHDLGATAQALRGDEEPAEVERGLRAWADRFPHAAAKAGAQSQPTGGDLTREAVKRAVIVRIVPPEAALRQARTATQVAGRGLPAAVRRHPLAAYFALAFACSWGYWIPVAAAGGRPSHFPGLLGPMLAAVLVTGVSQGRPGLRDLGSRMVRWRVPLRWYAAATLPLAVGLVALGVLWFAGAKLPSLAQLGDMPGLPALGWLAVLVLSLVVNGYGEETGWRGFAWPRLRQRHGLAGAALLLAVPWALWHLPLFWLDTGLRGFPLLMLPGLLVGMAAGAVVLGWLYEQARSSILVVALFHACLNMASATRGTEGLVATVVSIVIIGWAVVILRADGRHASRSGHNADPGW